MFKIAYLSIALLLLSKCFAFGQQNVVKNYKKDLAFLKEQFDKKYPSLYRFNTKATVDRLFDSCTVAINSGTTDRTFYAAINYILSKIEDGHLDCDPPNTQMAQLNDATKHAPFPICFIKERAYVDCDSGELLPDGTEIVAINEIDINHIKKELFNYIVSDGKIESNKYWVLNSSFWYYYYLVFGRQENYQIQYKETNGQIKSIVVYTTYLKSEDCNSATDKEIGDLLKLEYTRNNTAVLTIKSFDEGFFSEAGLNYPDFLETSFKDIAIKQPTALILDFRGNDGGTDVFGALLYSYLTDKTFRYYAQLQTATKILTEKDHPNLATQKPNPHNYMGKVYILINGLSFSVTAEFCSIAKDNNRAIFIGEETGGTYCGNTSGSANEITLPYSGIHVEIPTTKYTMALADTVNKDRGILPNYSVQPTIEDILKNTDVQLNFAVRLAERNVNDN